MQVKNTTQRFEGFVRDLQESFWGDFQGKTREVLKRLLEADAETAWPKNVGVHPSPPKPLRTNSGVPA